MDAFSSGVELMQALMAIYAIIFSFDLARYLLGAGSIYLLVNIGLAGILAARKIRPVSPSATQLRREIKLSLRTVAIFAFVGTTIAAGRSAGIFTIDDDPFARGVGGFAATIIGLILLHDAWFYWTHRLIHHPRLFRFAHRTHHKSRVPSPWTSYSFDIAEALANAIFLPLVLLVMPVSELAVFIFLAHMILRNAMAHCGYELFPARRDGRPMFDWIASVTHHDLHHAQAGWNFGFYFTWWDRLMGTEHPLYHEKFAQTVGVPLDGSAVRAINSSDARAGITSLCRQS